MEADKPINPSIEPHKAEKLIVQLEELSRSLLASLGALSHMMPNDSQLGEQDVKIFKSTGDLQIEDASCRAQPRLVLMTAMIYNAICTVLQKSPDANINVELAPVAHLGIKKSKSVMAMPALQDLDMLQVTLLESAHCFSPQQNELLGYVLANVAIFRSEFSKWIEATETHHSSLESMGEFNGVVSAIDRIIKQAPRYDAQTVAVSDGKKLQFDIAKLAGLIEKASVRPCMESQRSEIGRTKFGNGLDILINQLGSAAERKLVAQCYEVTPERAERNEKNKIASLVSSLGERYTGQVHYLI